MDIASLTLLLAGAAAGGFINGLAGFGTALFALGFWLQVFPPAEAVALAASLSVLSGIQGVWVVRRAVQPRRLSQFLVPAVLGLPLGVALLQRVDPAWLKQAVAVCLIAYGGWFSLRRIPTIGVVSPWADRAIGFSGGVLGGLAGLSGAVPMVWTTLRGWSKADSRAVLQPFNVIVLSIAVTLFAFDGVFTRELLTRLLVSIPVTLLAAQIGIALFKRLEDHQYRRLLVWVTLLSGFLLGLRTWVST